MRKLSRRDFLKQAGLASAGFALASRGVNLASASPPAQEPYEFALTMVDYSDPVQAALDEVIIPAFLEENPDSTVNVNYTAWDRYNEEMTTSFAAGVTPDVFQGGAVWAPQMAQRGWSLPLNVYIEADAEWDWEDFPAALRDDVTIGEDIVGVPYRQDLRTLWYRNDMLAEAGLEAPPTNWDEFLTFAKAAAQPAGTGIFDVVGYHFSSPSGGWQRDWQPYLMWLEMAGGSFLNEDNTKCLVNEEPGVEALQFLYDLIYEHEVMPYPGLEALGDLDPIVASVAAMTLTNADLERNMNLYAPEQNEFVWPAAPMIGNVQATHAWVNKFFISSLSKNPDRAWDLLRFLTSKEILITYCASNNNTPPRLSMLDAEYMTEKHKIVLEASNCARTFPKYWRLIETFRPIAQELEQALSNNKPVADALNDAADAIDQILAEDM